MNFSEIPRIIERNQFVLEASIYKVDSNYNEYNCKFYKKAFFKLKVENPPILKYTLKNVAFAKEFHNETVFHAFQGI